MPSIATFLLLAGMLACGVGGSTTTTPLPAQTLGQAAARHNIKVGAAADSQYLSDGNYAAILGSEFSQLQAENEMKFAIIHPAANTYDFSGGDALVSFAQSHAMAVRGRRSNAITECDPACNFGADCHGRGTGKSLCRQGVRSAKH